MTTKTQLLKEAGITVRKNAYTGLYRANLYAHSGATKCNQPIGDYETRELAVAAALETALGRHSFTQEDWNSAK